MHTCIPVKVFHKLTVHLIGSNIRLIVTTGETHLSKYANVHVCQCHLLYFLFAGYLHLMACCILQKEKRPLSDRSVPTIPEAVGKALQNAMCTPICHIKVPKGEEMMINGLEKDREHLLPYSILIIISERVVIISSCNYT